HTDRAPPGSALLLLSPPPRRAAPFSPNPAFPSSPGASSVQAYEFSDAFGARIAGARHHPVQVDAVADRPTAGVPAVPRQRLAALREAAGERGQAAAGNR